jgi:hypothetical protein
MFNCQLCDQYIARLKNLKPVSDLTLLRNYHANCKECDEFCKDSQRLLGKIPFANCSDYKKYNALSKMALDRQQAKLRKSALAMLPAMSQTTSKKVLSTLLPQAPTHTIVANKVAVAAPAPAPAVFMPQVPTNKPVLQPKPSSTVAVPSLPVVIVKKPCNPKSDKATNPNYECNPASGRWVLKKNR